MKKNITESLLSRLSSDIDLHITDTKITGFHVRYYARTGRRVFYQHYSVRFSKRIQRNFMLGVYGDISVANARLKAQVCRLDVHDGHDPMQELRDKSIARNRTILRQRFVKDVMEEYLNSHSRHYKKPASHAADKSLAKNNVFPMIGHLKLADLTLAKMQNFYDDIIRRRSPSLANHVFALMSHFWNWCERREYLRLNSNPCRHIQRLKQPKKMFKRLSIDDYRRFLATWESIYNRRIYCKSSMLVIKMLALTGCRCGEIRALKRSEVDLNNRFLRLSDSKTGAKSVPLGQAAIDVLRDALSMHTGKYVFPSPKRQKRPLADLRRPWFHILKESNLEGLRVHDLRHSFATMGVSLGENLLTIKNILGHTQISTTEIYAKSNEALQLKGADAISAAIIGAFTQPLHTAENDEYLIPEIPHISTGQSRCRASVF